MVQQANASQLELRGSADDKALANEVFALMRMRGFSYAASHPISLNLSDLAIYFADKKYKGHDKPETLTKLLDKALSANPIVFTREKVEVIDEETEQAQTQIYFRTTKAGKAPLAVVIDQHSFSTRLNQDARPVLPEEQNILRFADTAHPIDLPIPAAPVAAPPVVVPPTPIVTTPTVVAKQPVEPKTRPLGTPVGLPVIPPATNPTVVVPAVAKQPVEAKTRPTPAIQPPVATPVVTPVAPAVTGPVMLELAEGLSVDLNQPTAKILAEYGDYFASALQAGLDDDFRPVSFANDWYLEDATGRYNKNDFRNIRQYMTDTNEPVSDTAILSDVWGKRTTDADYEATRFALNFRLHKEKKDFEFVGALDDRIWTVPGLFQIGNMRYKATEIGTDYKYLEDAALNDPSELVIQNGVQVWRHVLTFYEYENGVLPYDATARQFFPAPSLEEQKSLILRFDAPQPYESYTAELRYPTGNRGGWLGGLESFFDNNLVPGAILLIRPGRKSNHFTVEYEQSEEQNANVLLYEVRRQKFVFRPIVFACQVEPADMLTSERYTKLNGQKRLEETDRKKTDLVIAQAFEYAAQKTAQGYYALLDDLYPVANIERPFSHNYLRQLLSHGNAQFSADETTPDAFYYKPPTTGVRR